MLKIFVVELTLAIALCSAQLSNYRLNNRIPLDEDCIEGEEQNRLADSMTNERDRENDIRAMRAMEQEMRMMRMTRYKVKDNSNNSNNNLNNNKIRLNAMRGQANNDDKYRFEEFRAPQQFDDEEERGAVGYKRRPEDRHKQKFARPVRGASLGFDAFWQSLALGFPLNLFGFGLGGGHRNFGFFF